MIMSRRIFSRVITAAVLLLSASFVSEAQTYSSFAPYSIFGVGDLQPQGTAYNKTMGGVGIASRDNRYLNPLNPASVTARDSLAFMIDFSLYEDNKVFRQGNMRSVNNTFNIGDLMISFPIYKSSAMMIGLMPYSSTGYQYGMLYTDPELIGTAGNIAYTASGMGGIYQVFAAAGVTFFKRLSLGVEGIYYFGSNEKKYYETFTDESYNGATNGYAMHLRAGSAKFGLQYEQPLGSKSKLSLGATYSLGANLSGIVEGYRFSTGTAASDTLYHKMDTLAYRKGSDKLRLAGELGVGLSYRYADKLMVEFDYTRSDWSGTNMDKVEGFMGNTVSGVGKSAFSCTQSNAYRFGMEFVPNRRDTRYYFKRVTYRAGAYYKNEYYTIDGQGINAMGITLGATLPVFRWYNGLTVGFDFGQRGSIKNNLVRETYFNFSLGVNLFDIWFQQPRYD